MWLVMYQKNFNATIKHKKFTTPWSQYAEKYMQIQ